MANEEESVELFGGVHPADIGVEGVLVGGRLSSSPSSWVTEPYPQCSSALSGLFSHRPSALSLICRTVFSLSAAH